MASDDESDRGLLEFPKESLGLQLLYEPSKNNPVVADVVAVHGIGGDSFSTWTHQATKKLWLRDMLPKSPYFANTRILTFGYDAQAWVTAGQTASRGRVFTFAEELLAMLRSRRLLTESVGRPIIFIGHSLGGIVIKKALVLALGRRLLYGDIYDCAKSITFLGTPHQGTDTAIWAKYLGKISKVCGVRSTDVTKGLQTWAEPLLDLSREFCELLPRLSINSFYETKEYKKILVVNEGSACLNFPTEVVSRLDANHRSICKYEDEKSSVYIAVLEQLEVRMVELGLYTPKIGSLAIHRAEPAATGIRRQSTEATAVGDDDDITNQSFPDTPKTLLPSKKKAKYHVKTVKEQASGNEYETLENRLRLLSPR